METTEPFSFRDHKQADPRPQTLGLASQILERDLDWSSSWVRHPISCGRGVKRPCVPTWQHGCPEAVLCGMEGKEGDGGGGTERGKAKLEEKVGEAGKHYKLCNSDAFPSCLELWP